MAVIEVVKGSFIHLVKADARTEILFVSVCVTAVCSRGQSCADVDIVQCEDEECRLATWKCLPLILTQMMWVEKEQD